MAQLISVKLSRFDGSPWGFRLQGGKDFGTPLIVQKVNGGSPAEAAGLKAGDAVIRVNNTDMFNLRHKDAQDVIVRSGNNFEMTVQRGGSTWRPSVSPVSQSIPSPQPHLSAGSVSPVTKTSLAAKKTDGHLIGSGHNFSPKPYPNGTSDSGAIKSIVNKQYNSPVGIYSEQTIAETLSAQAEVLAGGVLGVNFKKNEKNYTPENSEVFKMVREADKEPKTPEPTDSAIHSGVVTPSSPALTGLRSVSAPETKPQPTPPPQGSLPPGQNICAECERLIVGVFVRIKEKNLHVECFKCSTCGTSLKNVGYYNINSKLYCDIHAKLVARQQAPAGYIPVTVSPGAKAPASTISAALGNFQTHSAMSPTPFSNGNSSTPFSTRRTFYRPSSSSSSYTGDYYGVSSQPVDRTSTGTYESLSSDVNNRMIMKNDDVMNHQHNNNSNNYKTYTSTITIRTGSEVGNKDYYNDDINNTPSHLGSSPRADKSPSSSLVQGNISGPKPFGGSSNFGPSSNFNPTPTSNPITNNFSRPQSQTVTESYHAEYNYLEEKDIRGTPAPSTADEYSRPPSSVRNKSLQWPPIKSVEDITYPTASPIWIDPNPILDRRPRHNIQDKQSELKESSCRRSESVNRKRDDYRREESNYGYWGEEPMENKPVCSAPFYRKTTTTECSEVRQQSRSSSLTRPGSAEGVRRSLTPTRISQPVPRPWTGSSETGSYGHVQAPVPPPPESTICRKVCTCEIVCERISGPGGPEHEQEHVYREVKCEVCNPPPCMQVSDYDEEQQIEQPCDILDQQTDSEVVDLSKVVPPDVAVCPKGVENQHNMYTETMEKDEGNIHIKKTTIYEKTVEVVSPTSSPANDNEVENYSGRKKNVDSAEKISSFIETKRMIEEARQEELKQRETYEEECRREEEKIRRAQEEEERREANRLKLLQAEKEEKERRKQEQRRETEMRIRQEEEERSGKHVSFSQNQSRNYQNESRIMSAEEHYRELKSEIKVQNTDQFEEERRESLRQQVQVHKSLREQQAPERRQQQQQQQQQTSLQERRLEKRFRPQSPPQETSSSSSSCQRKHVQFVKQTESGTCPMQATPVPNSTPKEWKSEMVNALTTAPSRPYTPLQPSNLQSASQYHEDNNACSTKTMYSSEVRYEETSRSFPPPPQPQPYVPRPGSPFTDALTIAPERPYTPLGEDHSDRGYESVICVDRGETPINQSTPQGYCHPAEILYTDSTTRQSRSRERNLSKVQGPRPLPTPPANYKFRDASPSPARTLSRSETPRDPSLPASLKRPDTIPSYQKHLITEDYDPVEAHPYVPSRSPTPCRPKSPAQGPGYLPNPLQHNLGRKPYVSKVPDYDQPSSESYSYQSQSGSYSSYPEQQSKQVTYRAQQNSTPQSQCTESYGMRSYASEDHSEKQCSRTSYAEKYKRIEEKQLEACRQSEMMLSKSEESLVDESTCGISKISRNPPTLPCPVVAPQSSVSERIQRTGVRVLPTPCETTTSSSQVCESRPICHQQKETKCPNTGVTILPCRAISDAGSRAGIVIVPCEGSEAQCPQTGVRITPTPDRGLCVSPVAHGRSSGSCYGDDKPRAGGCQIDVGNCPGSGVKVGTCADGTVCVAPWKLSQCPKPILKCPAKPVPFPHIPLPDEEESGCDSCPLKNQQQQQQPAPQQDYNSPNTSYPSNNNSFKPINGQPRTNLSNQLTRLTVRRDKQLVQLFKPQPQSSQPCTDGVHCEPNVNRSCTDGVHCEPDPYRSPAPAQQNRTPNPSSYEPTRKTQNSVDPPNFSSYPDLGSGVGGPSNGGSCKFAGSSAPKRGRGILNQAGAGGRQPLCGHCHSNVRGPFITALGQIWCPEHFVCVNPQCRRPLHEIGFVEEKGQLYCEYCFERFIAPSCNKCNGKIKGDCLNAIGKAYHPDCFSCAYCGKIFGNSPFFLEEGLPYCEADWNELFTTKCFACGFPVEAGDRWVEALNNNYHSQCFNCTMCKKNLEGQSFYAKAGRPFCKNHAR